MKDVPTVPLDATMKTHTEMTAKEYNDNTSSKLWHWLRDIFPTPGEIRKAYQGIRENYDSMQALTYQGEASYFSYAEYYAYYVLDDPAYVYEPPPAGNGGEGGGDCWFFCFLD